MSQSLLIYHNPRCSKSRQALALLHEQQIAVTIKLYLKEGLEEDEIVELSKKLDLYPSEFIRKNEAIAQSLGADDFSLEEWAAIIAKHPILLERPIITNKTDAIIARPPERLVTWLAQLP